MFTCQEEFLSLCVEKLTEILTSDYLNVPKEEMVFEAAMLWLNKCPSRKQSFEKVRYIRAMYTPILLFCRRLQFCSRLKRIYADVFMNNFIAYAVDMYAT